VNGLELPPGAEATQLPFINAVLLGVRTDS
jgi:hypothetical protein